MEHNGFTLHNESFHGLQSRGKSLIQSKFIAEGCKLVEVPTGAQHLLDLDGLRSAMSNCSMTDHTVGPESRRSSVLMEDEPLWAWPSVASQRASEREAALMREALLPLCGPRCPFAGLRRAPIWKMYFGSKLSALTASIASGPTRSS